MKLNQIFEKPVERPIEGVIKADQLDNLQLELEEYVITDEVSQRIENFLENYNNYHGANGAWISGFFGSGKSHLLKMLSLVLENTPINGTPASEFFLEKLSDQPMVAGLLRKATQIPSKSILFNIDQKADIISKEQVDAVLSVFLKVFNEMCGYYGKHAHIAQFERDLDTNGLLQPFKEAYKDCAGKEWERGREQALLEAKNISDAYAKVTDTDPKDSFGILDKYSKYNNLSIEGFAELIQDYIEKQPANFRLNFFVDEVGQYIADNTKLMTNLQTIAESLATKSKGQAWIIVTSQSDIDAVIGDLSNKKGNDFTKIQARFKHRLQLTSANVEEVIQKRLLSKTDVASAELKVLYEQQSNNFKTLFDFADGSANYKNFRDEAHFIQSYPFIPYQYSLFQAAIQSLSLHNAFQGKHSSVGERSMLGVFQDVAKTIGNHELGQLATFDLMFEGIVHSLQSKAINSIIRANAHLEDEYARKVLKALFLVKFVREFKPTLRNICVLMRESFTQNPNELTEKVQGALNVLEQQIYIQRNGDVYEYLTDEEKEIETEIKNTEIDNRDISTSLQDIIFNQIVRQNKIRYDVNGQDYSYTKKLDGQTDGREYELSIHIISPFDEQVDQPNVLSTHSLMNPEELFIVMPQDEWLVKDLAMYLKTEKYIRREVTVSNDDTTKRILAEKATSNRRRQTDILHKIKDLIEKSTLLLAGVELEKSSGEAQTIILQGFHNLVSRSYPNLRMLRGVDYKENEIGKYLALAQDGLMGTDSMSLTESEQELFAYIQSNNNTGTRTTIKNLIEKFEKKPYGWYYAAILCNLAMLISRGKIETRLNGDLINSNELEKHLLNTQYQPQIVLEPQIEYSASQTRALKEFYNDFFDSSPKNNEAKGIAVEIIAGFGDVAQKMQNLVYEYQTYPFIQQLRPAIEKLNELKKKPYDKLIDDLKNFEDDLLDVKEDIIDPIQKFINGTQFSIYIDAKKFLDNQKGNEIYLDSNLIIELSSLLENQRCYQGQLLQRIKEMHDLLSQKINQTLTTAREDAIAEINLLLERMHGLDEYQNLDEIKQSDLKQPFNHLINGIKSQLLVAVIRDQLRNFQDNTYQHILKKIADYASANQLNDFVSNPTIIDPETQRQDTPRTPAVEYTRLNNINVPYRKAWLADENDIDDYIKALKEALVSELASGKRVQI